MEHAKLIYEINDSVSKNLPSIIQEIAKEIPMKPADQEITIESRGDSILRYKKPQLNSNLRYERIEENGKIYGYYMARDSNFFQYSYNLFEHKKDFNISVHKSEKKVILGRKCYKVIITEKEIIGRDISLQFGDIVYEMYVPDDISLPIHALIDIRVQFPGFFPLELKQWFTKTPEFFTLYTVKQILH